MKSDNIFLGGATVTSFYGERPAVVKVADFGESLDCQKWSCDEFKHRLGQASRGGAADHLPPEITAPGRKGGPNTFFLTSASPKGVKKRASSHVPKFI